MNTTNSSSREKTTFGQVQVAQKDLDLEEDFTYHTSIADEQEVLGQFKGEGRFDYYNPLDY